MRPYTIADRLKQIMKERGLKQVDILNLAKPYQTIPVRTPPIMIQPYGIVVVASY